MTTEIYAHVQVKAEGKNVAVPVDQATFNRVKAFKRRLGHRRYAQTVNYLLDRHQEVVTSEQTKEESVPLTPEDLVPAETAALIREAMAITGSDFAAFCASALNKEAKFQISLSKRHADLDFATLTTSKLSKTRHPDAARERVRRAIAAIASYNDEAASALDCWIINPTVIQQLVGVRFELIAHYLAEHQAEIEMLNAKYGQTGRYNRKVSRIAAVIMVAEEPDGVNLADG